MSNKSDRFFEATALFIVIGVVLFVVSLFVNPEWTLGKMNKQFQQGTVVVWTPDNFNKDYWAGLSEEERVKYYGPLGYGAEKPKLFVFMTAILDAKGSDTGHCVLVSLDNQQIETMRHTCEFREASENEF